MSRHSKLITVLLAIIFCLGALSFSVYADEDDPGQGGDTPVVDPVTDPDPNNDDPNQGGYEDPNQGGYEDPNQGGYEDPNQGGYEDPNQGYVDPDPGNYDPNTGTGNGGENIWYDGDGNAYTDQSEIYVGGGQSYEPPASTAPSAALYDTDKKIDVNELSKGDWGDIAARLKNAGSEDDDGSGDFAFIQQNTSKTDNGHWIIITGVLCVLLSLTGFIYLIASGISRRRKIKAGNITRRTENPNNRYRASNDYDDGFKAQSKKETMQSKSGKGGKRYR